MRVLSFVYGVFCYALFLAVFLVLIAFVGDVGGPWTVSGGVPQDPIPAALTDVALLALFGVQHSVMARRSFKNWLTRFVAPAVERSTYVLATNLAFIALFTGWQPVPGVLWTIENPTLVTATRVVGGMGWLIALLSTFLTTHFVLFGRRQVWLNWQRQAYSPVPFKENFFYRWIRHPMMLGLLIAFWAAPVMSVSHALFSAGMSIYIVIGIHFEERGLKRELGQPYQDYVQRTVRFLPFY